MKKHNYDIFKNSLICFLIFLSFQCNALTNKDIIKNFNECKQLCDSLLQFNKQADIHSCIRRCEISNELDICESNCDTKYPGVFTFLGTIKSKQAQECSQPCYDKVAISYRELKQKSSSDPIHATTDKEIKDGPRENKPRIDSSPGNCPQPSAISK